MVPAPTAADLAKEYRCVELARTYRETVEELGRLMDAIDERCKALSVAFQFGAVEQDAYAPGFGIDFGFDGQNSRYRRRDDIFGAFKRRAWRVLVNKLGLRQIMSVARRAEFDKPLESGELPEIGEDTITDILCGLAGQAQDFATEAAREVFGILRPQHSEYKTNDAFRVGRKVILRWTVERCWNGTSFRPYHSRESHLTAIDGVFHRLDGKGVLRDHRGPLIRAINDSPSGHGETEYFRFRCYKNMNLHLEFKRLDLVRALNMQAVGEAVIGRDHE
jgi:hypothetical protein